jgi:hypothetical protein
MENICERFGMKYIELTQLTFIGPASGIEEIVKEKIMINFDKVHSFFPYNTSDHSSDKFGCHFIGVRKQGNYSKIEMKSSMITVEESYDTIKDKLK